MEIKIEARAEYEMYIRSILKKANVSGRVAELAFIAALAAFDDGLLFAQGKLYVDPPRL